MTDLLSVAFGGRSGILAVGLGHRPYRTENGRYTHADWSERTFRWPDDAHVLATDVAGLSEPVDVFFCQAVRNASGRRQGGALEPLTLLWADLDGPTHAPDVLAALSPILVDSGTPGHLHVYVPLSEPVDRRPTNGTTRRVAAVLGGDAKWVDNSLLRLPGTINHKTRAPGRSTTGRWSGAVCTRARRAAARRHERACSARDGSTDGGGRASPRPAARWRQHAHALRATRTKITLRLWLQDHPAGAA